MTTSDQQRIRAARVHSPPVMQGYVLRVPSTFRFVLASGVSVTCAQAVSGLLRDQRRWEVCSAGKGSKGDRW